MELSVKALAAAIAEAQAPMFETLGKQLSAGQISARGEAIDTLMKQAQDDPNSAKFLQMLTLTPNQRQAALVAEAKDAKERGAGLKAARLARATALCKREYGSNIERIPSIIADVYKDKAMAEDLVEKGLTISDPAAGGFLAGETYADDFIALLRPETILGQLGARPYPMASAKVHVPRLDAASSGYWVGEAKRISTSKPSVGRTTLSEHYAAGLVPISNALLRDSSPAADAVVRDDMIKVLKLLVDKAAIDGAGNEFVPLGLKNAGIQTFSVGARLDPDTVINMMEALWTANVPMINPGIFFNMKLRRDFLTLKSATGEYYYRKEMAEGKIDGNNWAATTQIATGSDQYGLTDMYIGDFSEFFIGERTNLGFSIDSSAEAAYYDGSTTQSAYQNLETLIRATYVTDFLLRHKESFVMANDVYTVTP